MKYIVMKSESEEEEIFLFPRHIDHDCMAEVLGRIKNQSFGNWHRVLRQLVSAGFVDDGHCHGRSESLGLASRPQDTELLGKFAAPPTFENKRKIT